MPDYGDHKYWDTRYKTSIASIPIFDWYNDYDAFKTVLAPLLKRKEASILHVGCGNSTLPERLYDDGYKRVVNIDVSETCIKAMLERNKERRPELRFEVADVTDLSQFTEDEFDLVIDKGTLDSILCGTNATQHANSMCSEILRVLRAGGSFLCMSYGQPQDREQYLVSPVTSEVPESSVGKGSGEGAKQRQEQGIQVMQWGDVSIKFCKKPNLKDVKDGIKERFQVYDYDKEENESPSDTTNAPDDTQKSSEESGKESAESESGNASKTVNETVAQKSEAEPDTILPVPVMVPANPPKKMTEMHSYHFFYILTKKVIRNLPSVSWLTDGNPSEEDQSKEESKAVDGSSSSEVSQGDDPAGSTT